MVEKNHLYHIDLIRLISVTAIMAIHVSGIIFNLYPRIDGPAWSLSLVFQAIFRWGTPLFVMISGYLLLNSSTSLSLRTFYRHRLDRLLIPFIFWNIFYYFLDSRLQLFPVSLADLLGHIWRADTYYHLYFLFLITGLYLITPFLKKLIDQKVNLSFLVPALVVLSYLYTIGAVWLDWPQLNLFINWFVLYIGYYLSGYWLPRLNLKFRFWYFLVLLLPFLGVIVDIYFINIFGISDKGTLLTHRLSPLIALPAFVIFLKFIKTSNSFFEKFHLTRIRHLADLSMGIYLIHPALLEIFTKTPSFAALLHQNPLVWLLVSFILLIPLSIIAVSIIKKIPVLSRIV